MRWFTVNGDLWRVRVVGPDSRSLVDRAGRLCLGTTDPDAMTVYLSSDLRGDMLDRVLVHEMGHCVIWSYGLFDEIHRMVRPGHWAEAEEWVCNFIADYGYEVFEGARQVLGRRAVICVPSALERFVA